MPNLPRIPRTVRRRDRSPQRPAERSEPQVAEIAAAGLRWLNIEGPTAAETAWLAQHFDFHELDLEDVLSTRQRPKIDEYDEYLFIVLHVPHFNKVRGRLDAAELNVFVGNGFLVTLPNVRLKPIGAAVHRSSRTPGAARALLLERVRATCSTRSCPSSSTTASRSSTRSGSSSTGSTEAIFDRAAVGGRRPRHLGCEAGDRRATARSSSRSASTLRLLERVAHALPARGPRGLLRRRRRQGRADLGPARQLQGGRRGARDRPTSR